MRFDTADMLHPLVRAAGELRESSHPPPLAGVLVALGREAHVLAVHSTRDHLDELALHLCRDCKAERVIWLATHGDRRPYDQLTSELRAKYGLSERACARWRPADRERIPEGNSR